MNFGGDEISSPLRSALGKCYLTPPMRIRRSCGLAPTALCRQPPWIPTAPGDRPCPRIDTLRLTADAIQFDESAPAPGKQAPEVLDPRLVRSGTTIICELENHGQGSGLVFCDVFNVR
jgi:hypothetical protein